MYSESKGTLGCAQHNNGFRLITWRIKHLFDQPCLVRLQPADSYKTYVCIVTPSVFYRALLELLKHDIKPRDIMTKQAFENAITVVMALGGSTNAVIHLLAMAHSVDVPLSIDDFQTISDRTPFIADLKPSGKYVMEDIHKVGHHVESGAVVVLYVQEHA